MFDELSGLEHCTKLGEDSLALEAVGHEPDRWVLLAALENAALDPALSPRSRDALRAALRALCSVPLHQQQLDDEQTEALSAAIRAVQKIASLYPDSPAGELAAVTSGADGLQRQLGQAMTRFLLRDAGSRVATFSLILFTDEHHDGAVLKSFQTGEWSQIIRPLRDGAVDSHLALVPPPGSHAVQRLAALMGAPSDKPCVVFLGSSMDLSSSVLRRVAIRTLNKDQPYPEQLLKIYDTVYNPKAIAPGEPASAAVDKLIDTVAKDPWFWLQVAARVTYGAVGAAAAQMLQGLAGGDLEQVEPLRDLVMQEVFRTGADGDGALKDDDLQINLGTIFVYQEHDPEPVGQMFAEPDPNNAHKVVEHWLLYDSFRPDEDYRVEFVKDENDWYANYLDFRSKTQTLWSKPGYRYMRAQCNYMSNMP